MPRHEPGYSTTSFYSLRNSSKRSEPATNALTEHHADNQIREKPHLVATSVPSNNKGNTKFLLVGGYCSLCQLPAQLMFLSQ